MTARFRSHIMGSRLGLLSLFALCAVAAGSHAADPPKNITRITFAYGTKDEFNTFRREDDKKWGEYDSKGKLLYQFELVKLKHNSEVITLYDSNRKCTVEIYDNGYRWKFDGDKEWSEKVKGHWQK